MTNYGVVSFLVLILAMMACKPCLGSSKLQRPFTDWTVTIVNNLSPGQVLNLECRSGDDDLGNHDLLPGNKFSWKFKENFFVTTRFWCTFQTTMTTGTFSKLFARMDVFWRETQDWLSYRCNYATCVWIAGGDGIYILNIPKNTVELVHKWTYA